MSEDTIMRNKKIADMRNNGMTYKKIGIQFGISNERVRQIVVKEERKREEATNKTKKIVEYDGQNLCDIPLDGIGLSVRAFNCLLNANIKTMGELMKKSERELMKMKNVGRVTSREIKEAIWKLFPDDDTRKFYETELYLAEIERHVRKLDAVLKPIHATIVAAGKTLSSLLQAMTDHERTDLLVTELTLMTRDKA